MVDKYGSWTVNQLKIELKNRNAKCVGKKEALIENFLSTRKPRKYPPGPKWLPIMGSASLMKKLSIEHGGMHKAVEKLNEDYQTNILGLKLGKDNVVVVSSYELLKEILWREEFEGRPDNFFIRLRCMGTKKGITMTDGHFSKIQRNFVKSHLRELGFGKEYMETLIRDEFREILQIIEENIYNGIEFSKLIPLSVINVIWAISSGFRMSRNDERLMSLLNIMKERSQLFDIAGGLLNQVPWLSYVAPEKTGYNTIKKLNNQLKILIMQTIDEHKQTWTPGRKDDLVYAFVSQMNNENVDNSTFTEDQLVMICLDLFIAGSVSTSNTLDYAFLMMILYPEIQTKVQLAIDEVFQKCEQISYKDRNRIPYVEAVLNEIQRYCSVAPIGGPRRATKDVELGDYVIPKDTTILFSIYSSHNDKEYWKDPEVFRPNRFLSEDGSLINHNRFMPFSIGIRRCLGEVLAKSCVFTFFAETLRQYNISAYPGMPKPTGKIIPGMLTGPEKYKAKLTRRT